MNIIVNGCQSIDERKKHGANFDGQVIVSSSKENNQLVIRVKDNGTGMEDSTARRVFEPFFTTKDIGCGTGLGLAISFGIIKDHNGSINIDSSLEHGTTVSICLPIK